MLEERVSPVLFSPSATVFAGAGRGLAPANARHKPPFPKPERRSSLNSQRRAQHDVNFRVLHGTEIDHRLLHGRPFRLFRDRTRDAWAIFDPSYSKAFKRWHKIELCGVSLFPILSVNKRGTDHMDAGNKLVKAVWTVMIVVAVGMVSACGKMSSPQGAAEPVGQSEHETKSFEISEIRVNELEGGAPTQTSPGDPIVITVSSSGAPSGEILEVKLFDLGSGAIVASEKRPLEANSGDSHVFTFKREDPWTPGRYLIEMTIGGQLAGHRELDVIESVPVAQ